jgi:hypothetical protein
MKNLSARWLPYHLLLLLVLAVPAAWGQAPAWQLAVGASSASTSINNTSLVRATAPGASGNVYLAGQFVGTLGLGGLTLSSAGSTDIFVAKWNPTTGFVWAQRAGGAGPDNAAAVAVSGNSVYVAGEFSGVAGFGSSSLTVNGTFSDAFVAKLTDAGTTATFGWAQRMGSTSADAATALAVSGTDVYVAGYAAGPASFGTLVVASAGGSDAFVAKLADAGSTSTFTWARLAGGTTNEIAYGVAVDGPNVYLTGHFSSPTASFGPVALAALGGTDIFVAKLTDSGPAASFVWAQRAGGFTNDYAFTVAVAGTAVYVVGRFDSLTAAFGGITLTNPASTGTDPEAFVAKLTDAGSSGSFVWAQRMGGTSTDIAVGLAVRSPYVYVAGHYSSATASFGPFTLANSTAMADVFLAKLTDAGPSSSFAWVQSAGGANFDFAYNVALAGSRVYVGGSVTPAASFGPVAIATPTATAVGFLAGLTDPNLTATTAALLPERIDLFPNPAHGRATVQLPASTSPATLTILDGLGRTLRTQTAAATAKTELDLTGLAPGFYAVRVAADGSSATQKLVVE